MKKRKIILALAVVLAVILAFTAGMLAFGKGRTTWQTEYDLGERYLSEGEYSQAVLSFTAAIEIDPQKPEAYIGRGAAYVAQGDTIENLTAARTDYETAVSLDKSNPEAWLDLADVYIRQKDYEKALEILEEGLIETGGSDEIAEKIEEIQSGHITDSAGNLRRMNHYDEAGVLDWYHIYDYDTMGQQSAVTSYDANGQQTGHVDLTYTESGQDETSYSYSDSDGTIAKIIVEYNADDQIARRIMYDVDGTLEFYDQYQYDANGQIAIMEEIRADGTLLGTARYTYDSRGNQIQVDWYNTDGVRTAYDQWEYNDADQCVKHIYRRGGSWEYEEIYSYDEEGRLVSIETYDSEGNLTGSTVYNS